MKKPMIVGNHLKVTSFKGISLSMKANSSIFVNPKFQKLAKLRQWSEGNKEILTEMITQKTYDLSNTPAIPPPLKNRIISTRDISENTSIRKPFWITGKVEMSTRSRSLWYMACDTCGWMSFARLNEMYLCNYCKYMHARAVPRAKCSVNIKDHTGNIIASLFGDVAEKFLHLPAEKIMKDAIIIYYINLII
ncbi:replication protein A 70 kDa DNA-binding subunit D-like, partial [Olea europaea var. sylvestris]|uniref:replication protein A 70 kDa DNA-binding subunit D-like n=1 Tax=Olea europaea var. sylvestris TaxID=158386 RepID=UPI000C1D4578